MSSYDTNLDELENLLRDLDGRPKSVVPNSRKTKSSSINFDELDDIINVLGDASTPKTGTVEAKRAPQQQYNNPQQYNNKSNDNRNTLENIDDLLRGLESNRSSARVSVAPQAVAAQPKPQVNVQRPNNAYNNGNNYNGGANARGSIITHNNNVPFNPTAPKANNTQASAQHAPLTAASQKVFVAKPPSVRPVAGDELTSLLDNLTKDSAPISSPSAKGACAACGKPILGESISALGLTYHFEHFACGNCRQPIGTGSFFEQDGVPHCERCYQELLCARCAHCDEPIVDKCVTALGRKWHMHHFICTQCLSPFPNGSYFEKDSRPYCESCFSGAFAPRCAGCNQPVKGECTNALGQAWHPEHFVCQFCQKAFTGSFYEFAGKPYCDVHYHQQTGSLCAGCSKAITGKCVNALDKKWHPEHFICAFCMNPLVGGNFTENGNKAYCKECHGKLFG